MAEQEKQRGWACGKCMTIYPLANGAICPKCDLLMKQTFFLTEEELESYERNRVELAADAGELLAAGQPMVVFEDCTVTFTKGSFSNYQYTKMEIRDEDGSLIHSSDHRSYDRE